MTELVDQKDELLAAIRDLLEMIHIELKELNEREDRRDARERGIR